MKAWTPEELSALHNELIEAAGRAAADGSAWIARAADKTGGSSSHGVINAPGSQPTVINQTAAPVLPTDVAGVHRYQASRITRSFARAIAPAAIVLIVLTVVFWSVPKMKEAPSTPNTPQDASVEDGLYRTARGNLTQLRNYVATCKFCAFKEEANADIQEFERKERVENEDSTYRSAKGDTARLRGYLQSCVFCTHRSDAAAEVQNIERNQLSNVEEAQYRAALGNVDALKGYLSNCKLCAFASVARAEVNRLEEAAKYATFRVCNSSSYQIVVAASGRRNPASGDFSIEGWFSAAPGSCSTIGRFTKGKVYAVAMVQGSSLGWRGLDIKLCVRIPGPFNRVAAANYSCMANERLESFREFSVTDDVTWTINSEPEESEDYFTFAVCNQSNVWAAVAVSGREQYASRDWIVQGWHQVGPGQCQDIGKYARGDFYALAQVLNHSDAGWKGADLWLCVQYPGPFRRINRGNEVCNSQELQPFRQFYITSPRYVWSLGR